MPLEPVTLVNRGTGSAPRRSPAESKRHKPSHTRMALQQRTATGPEGVETGDRSPPVAPNRQVRDGNHLVFKVL